MLLSIILAVANIINAYVKCQRSRQTVVNSKYYLLRIVPSFCMEQRDTHWTNFREISYLDLLIKFSTT